MYKNYNMFQLTLPIETEMSFPENDIVFIINKLVESIPQEAFNPYYSQRGPSSYYKRQDKYVQFCLNKHVQFYSFSEGKWFFSL
ncbi:hypothetical protein CD134_04820 [Staphylococcus lutrae]|nr:hypothetical protein CD134_04820 [Staphylococcus lutrae]